MKRLLKKVPKGKVALKLSVKTLDTAAVPEKTRKLRPDIATKVVKRSTRRTARPTSLGVS